MARLKRNSLLSSLQGTIGKEIIFKQYADKTVVSKYPDMSKVKTSKRQRAQRDLLKEANAYASAAKRDPKLRKKYEKKLKPGESVFHKAKKEFFEREKKKLKRF
jgi:hypothetical protein